MGRHINRGDQPPATAVPNIGPPGHQRPRSKKSGRRVAGATVFMLGGLAQRCRGGRSVRKKTRDAPPRDFTDVTPAFLTNIGVSPRTHVVDFDQPITGPRRTRSESYRVRPGFEVDKHGSVTCCTRKGERTN